MASDDVERLQSSVDQIQADLRTLMDSLAAQNTRVAVLESSRDDGGKTIGILVAGVSALATVAAVCMSAIALFWQ